MKPRYNEPLYDDFLDITNNFLYPRNSKIFEKEPRYNEPLDNKVLNVTNSFLYPNTLIVKYMKKNLDITKPRYSQQILPVPWPFVISRFHCILLNHKRQVYFLVQSPLSVKRDGISMLLSKSYPSLSMVLWLFGYPPADQKGKGLCQARTMVFLSLCNLRRNITTLILHYLMTFST